MPYYVHRSYKEVCLYTNLERHGAWLRVESEGSKRKSPWETAAHGHLTPQARPLRARRTSARGGGAFSFAARQHQKIVRDAEHCTSQASDGSHMCMVHTHTHNTFDCFTGAPRGAETRKVRRDVQLAATRPDQRNCAPHAGAPQMRARCSAQLHMGGHSPICNSFLSARPAAMPHC